MNALNAILPWEINHWPDLSTFRGSNQHMVFFILLLPSLFSSCHEMTERVINCWNLPVGLLTHTHTYAHMQSDAHRNSNSSFVWGPVNGAVWRAQFPWQQAWGLGWKTVIPEQLSEHLDSEEHLRVKGRSRHRTGVEIQEFGSLGRIKGEMKEWVMILLKITLPPHPCSL